MQASPFYCLQPVGKTAQTPTNCLVLAVDSLEVNAAQPGSSALTYDLQARRLWLSFHQLLRSTNRQLTLNWIYLRICPSYCWHLGSHEEAVVGCERYIAFRSKHVVNFLLSQKKTFVPRLRHNFCFRSLDLSYLHDKIYRHMEFN